VIYYIGHKGRLWQVHSTYLNKGREKRKVQREREKKEKGKYRKGDEKETR